MEIVALVQATVAFQELCAVARVEYDAVWRRAVEDASIIVESKVCRQRLEFLCAHY